MSAPQVATLSDKTTDAMRRLSIRFEHRPECRDRALYDQRPTRGKHAGNAVIRCHGCPAHLVIYAHSLERAAAITARATTQMTAHRGKVMLCPDCGRYRPAASGKPRRARCGQCHKAATS